MYNKCLRHLKGIKLKYKNIYVYRKAKPSLPVVGVEPRLLVLEGNTLLEEPLQASTARLVTTPPGGEITYLAPLL